MDDFSEKELKIYFSRRIAVPQELKARTSLLLRSAESRENQPPFKLVWGIAAFEFIISCAIIYVLWVLFGQGLFVLVAALFFGMSLISIVTLTMIRYAGRGIAWSGL